MPHNEGVWCVLVLDSNKCTNGKKNARFLGYPVNGELIKKRSDIGVRIGSFDHQSLKREILTIPLIRDMVYTANFVLSLVLIDE